MVSIGKLHYRSSDDPNGSSEEILPLHVLDGRGDLQGMLRRPPPRRGSTRLLAADAGAGESTYLAYDRQIRDAAIRWLERAAKAPPAKPWVLFVSFVCPHFPRVAPPEAAGSAAAVRWHQRAEGRFGAGAGDGRD